MKRYDLKKKQIMVSRSCTGLIFKTSRLRLLWGFSEASLRLLSCFFEAYLSSLLRLIQFNLGEEAGEKADEKAGEKAGEDSLTPSLLTHPSTT